MIASIIVARGGPDGRERGTRNHPLPAERLRLGAITNYQSLTRVSRLSADTAGRREVVTDRIRVRRGPAFGGIWKNVRLLNPARISFLGSARVHLRQKPPRCRAQCFHVQNSLSDAPACHEQSDRSDVECPTKALKRLTR